MTNETEKTRKAILDNDVGVRNALSALRRAGRKFELAKEEHEYLSRGAQRAVAAALDVKDEDIDLGIRLCGGSPTGRCIYNVRVDPTQDHCLVCGESEAHEFNSMDKMTGAIVRIGELCVRHEKDPVPDVVKRIEEIAEGSLPSGDMGPGWPSNKHRVVT